MIVKRRWIINKVNSLVPWRLMGVLFSIISGSAFRRWRFSYSKVGPGSYIDSTVQIIGWQNVNIGSNTVVSEDSWLNVNFREDVAKVIDIGSNCHIGRRNFFSSGPLIRIGDYCMTSVDCHFLGAGHIIEDPMIPYLGSGPSEGKKIILGTNVWLGASVTVLAGVEIGRGSIIGATSVVTHSIPPFCIALGTPCEVVKRYDFIQRAWIPIDEWNEALEQAMPGEAGYLATLRANYPRIGRSLIASGSSFGWL